MAGSSPDIVGGQDGMVSLWEEAGPPGIHLSGREREPPFPGFGCGHAALMIFGLLFVYLRRGDVKAVCR